MVLDVWDPWRCTACCCAAYRRGNRCNAQRDLCSVARGLAAALHLDESGAKYRNANCSSQHEHECRA